MNEKRGAPRQKSLLRGIVYFGGSPCAVECLVRDVSETGARLKFQLPPAPCDALDLHIPIKGQKLHAHVRWQQNDEIGIAFTAMPSAAARPPVTPAATTSYEDLAERVQRLETELAVLQQLMRKLQQKTANKSDVP